MKDINDTKTLDLVDDLSSTSDKSQKIGYVRVSSIDQNTARQLDGLELDKIFTEKCSGKDLKRPKLLEMIDYARSGDVVYVHSIDRLARNLTDLLKTVEKLLSKGVGVVFVKNNLSFFSKKNDNPMNKLMLQMLGAFAEFEREIIKERQREGLEKAKKNGVKLGRKSKLTQENIARIDELLALKNSSVEQYKTLTYAEICKQVGISKTTLFKHLDNKKKH